MCSEWFAPINRKKQQRKINRLIRKMNKNIENDPLWKGRFCARQILTPEWTVYEDKSGAELFVQFLFIDKKTEKVFHCADSVSSWCHWGGSKLWEKMNWFITEYCRIWYDEDPRPTIYNAVDYTQVKIDIEKLKEKR